MSRAGDLFIEPGDSFSDFADEMENDPSSLVSERTDFTKTDSEAIGVVSNVSTNESGGNTATITVSSELRLAIFLQQSTWGEEIVDTMTGAAQSAIDTVLGSVGLDFGFGSPDEIEIVDDGVLTGTIAFSPDLGFSNILPDEAGSSEESVESMIASRAANTLGVDVGVVEDMVSVEFDNARQLEFGENFIESVEFRISEEEVAPEQSPEDFLIALAGASSALFLLEGDGRADVTMDDFNSFDDLEQPSNPLRVSRRLEVTTPTITIPEDVSINELVGFRNFPRVNINASAGSALNELNVETTHTIPPNHLLNVQRGGGVLEDAECLDISGYEDFFNSVSSFRNNIESTVNDMESVTPRLESIQSELDSITTTDITNVTSFSQIEGDLSPDMQDTIASWSDDIEEGRRLLDRPTRLEQRVDNVSVTLADIRRQAEDLDLLDCFERVDELVDEIRELQSEAEELSDELEELVSNLEFLLRTEFSNIESGFGCSDVEEDFSNIVNGIEQLDVQYENIQDRAPSNRDETEIQNIENEASQLRSRLRDAKGGDYECNRWENMARRIERGVGQLRVISPEDIPCSERFSEIDSKLAELESRSNNITPDITEGELQEINDLESEVGSLIEGVDDADCLSEFRARLGRVNREVDRIARPVRIGEAELSEAREQREQIINSIQQQIEQARELEIDQDTDIDDVI